MGKGVWGIDVSKFSIKAVKLEKGPAGLMATQMGVMPFEGTDTGEPVNLDDQIRLTLAELKVRLKIGSDRVVISLPGHSTFNRLIKLPPVDDSKLNEVVRYEAQSQIPFPIDEVIWDFQYVDRKYGVGEEKEVILFAIKKDVVEQFLTNIQGIGLNIEAIQFGPVALYNFLSFDQDVGSSCIAVDMGADNSDLIVIDGPKFWIRNLPITGADITKALQKGFNIPFAEAEKLKVKAPQSQQAQKIFNAIQPVLRDLIGEIHRSVGYYKSISKQVRFEKILLIGNATRVLNFQKFVSQSLQMPAVRLAKLNHIGIGGGLDPTQFGEDLTTVGTAIGLALQGWGETSNRVNLLPPAYLKKREMKKKQPFVVGIVAVLYIMVGIMWMLADGELSALTTKANSAAKAKTTVKTQTETLETLKAEVAKIEAPLKKVDLLWRERDLILQVMNLVHANIPDNGNLGLAQVQRVWLLEWSFQEAPRTPGSSQPGMKVLDQDRRLTIKIETAVEVANRQPTDLDKFIMNQLLGVVDSGGGKLARSGAKSSVVDTFKLVRVQSSDKRFDIKYLGRTEDLEPISVQLKSGATLNQNDGRFAILEVTLEFPIRKEVREPAKAPDAPKQP